MMQQVKRLHQRDFSSKVPEPLRNSSEEKLGTVLFLDSSNSCPIDIQEKRKHLLNNTDGDGLNLPSDQQPVGERLVRDEQTNELYLQLTSTVILKRKQEMLIVPLDFDNNLTTDASVDLEAYVSAIAQNESDTIKKASNNIFKIDDSLNFQLQVESDQLKKPLKTALL